MKATDVKECHLVSFEANKRLNGNTGLTSSLEPQILNHTSSEEPWGSFMAIQTSLSPVVNLAQSYLCFQFGSHLHLDGAEWSRIEIQASGRLHAFCGFSEKVSVKATLTEPHVS